MTTMMNKTIKKQENVVAKSNEELLDVLTNYFSEGDVEHHIGLLSNAIQEIVQKGADDTDAGLDKPFGFTRRYIRESVYDLTQLQKFLLRLAVVYADSERKKSVLCAMLDDAFCDRSKRA